MLTVHHLYKSFGVEQILADVTFSVNPGERLGLVGPNGSGKTTLLRILAGAERPDAGGVLCDPGLRTGYLPQGLMPGPDDTLASFLAGWEGDLDGLTAQLEALAAGLAAPQAAEAAAGALPEDLQAEYDEVLARLAGAAESAGRAPAVLAGLGLGEFSLETPVAHLSGGQKTRLALAGVLLSNPQLLLLDEPTNHLDLDMLAWLEDWLLAYPGAALVVSHDRTFLNRTATGILELDPDTHHLRTYPGDYTAYLETRLAERERQWQEYGDWQEEVARLKRAAARVRGDAAFKRGGKGDSGDKFAKGFFGNRSTKGTVGRAKHIEARVERLLSDERVEKPRSSWQMKLDFAGDPAGAGGAARSGMNPGGRDVLLLENLSIGYGDRPLLEALNLSVQRGDRVVLVGPNGAGKTTLLRTIAGLLPPLAGRARLGGGVQAGYMAQEGEDLDPALDALATLRRAAPFSDTEARRFLHQFLFSGDDVFRPVGQLSYGERARLSLACLAARGCNLLLLDEPLNHLDIPSRSRFEAALASYEGTVLAVVHDRYFIDGFAAHIWRVGAEGISVAYEG